MIEPCPKNRCAEQINESSGGPSLSIGQLSSQSRILFPSESTKPSLLDFDSHLTGFDLKRQRNTRLVRRFLLTRTRTPTEHPQGFK
ncbi:hypothetical protein EVAR_55431_1 [Eumeta japonica]|uniref:Uncharacterized protein n=1 Tax=Eumeta variegata TaxID=151549 RepID=A0A4C1Z7K4_EUMVA|nr:hypothetical protein EVAR_55431_1 [Eumeta japonica]